MNIGGLLLCCAQLCQTLCDGSSVLGISQVGILEWVAISYSRGSSQPRDWTRLMSPAFTGRFITTSATWEAHIHKFHSLQEIQEKEMATQPRILA